MLGYAKDTTPYRVSIRCHCPDGTYTEHWQDMPLQDIPMWMECYRFTHPKCVGFKIWIALPREDVNNTSVLNNI